MESHWEAAGLENSGKRRRATQLTRNGGFAPIESPDGQFLYYTDTIFGRCSVWKAAVDGGEATKILDGLRD